jgi:Cdc6-like AAA superfamily ATPase
MEERDPAHNGKQIPIAFEDLARHRKLLQEFCTLHAAGMIPFFYDKWGIFALHVKDDPGGFRHITSNATCFSSLELCPEAENAIGTLNFRESGLAFAQTAIEQDVAVKWRSDGRAEVYCTCRGLPFVVSKLSGWHDNINTHLNRVAYQLREQSDRFAIGEAAPPLDNKKKDEEIRGWYKPNAYHTYWVIELLEGLGDDRFAAGCEASADYKFLADKIPLFKLWARQQLGLQVALHSGNSSKLDSDQLAWSLAILTRQPEDYQSDLALQDIIRESLKCLFSTQEPVGTWRHYAPLFHYPHSGNAYCYVFETFAALLEQALKQEAEFLRTVLREHASGLIKLWRFADSTKAKLPNDRRVVAGKSYGWSSGHRIQPEIESWATASVFAYAQTLRRLIGIWTCEEALGGLNHKRSTRSPQKALQILNKRGRTWTRPDLPDTLASMFINPRYADQPRTTLDPDRFLIPEDFARSVILFGPPGTGKTTLVSGLADAIGWKYIELHPSHFVSEGLPNVQQTADGIFGRLMELDHAVILLDEIDELVREREMEPDQFGRFLTTSMLPRLAELWKARKVIYFVATNHIEFFDRAITRSERFDAVVFLSPPTFDVKRDEILKILQTVYSVKAEFDGALTQALIEKKLPRAADCQSAQNAKREIRKAKLAAPPPQDNLLSKFALVRWDELNEIALRLVGLVQKDGRITPQLLEKSLEQMKDGKVRGLGEYCRFISDPDSYERFDASRMGLWRVLEVEGLDLSKTDPPPRPFQSLGGQLFAKAPIGSPQNIYFNGYTPELLKPDERDVSLGTVKLSLKKT